jgi:KilA-N domain
MIYVMNKLRTAFIMEFLETSSWLWIRTRVVSTPLKLCNDGGKKFAYWTRLEKSKRLLEFYKDKSRVYSSTLGQVGFYEVKGDNKNDMTAKTTGQYVQKELILDIASWISVEFYDKCNEIIVDFFVTEFKNRETDLQNQIKLAHENMKKLQADNIEKNDKITDLEVMMNQMKIDSDA